MVIVARILMGLFLLATPFLFLGFGGELLNIFRRFSVYDARWLSFLAGAVLFFPVWFIGRTVLVNTWDYLTTFEHEMTHLIVGLFFLKMPVSFRVSARHGGEVKSVGFGSTGQTWVTLAPYFFPTVALVLLVVAYFAELRPGVFLALLGWSAAFHLITNWAETSFRQPDLKKAGVVKTLLILPVMNLLSYGTILAFVAGGRAGLSGFWIEGLRGAWGVAAQLRHLTGV